MSEYRQFTYLLDRLAAVTGREPVQAGGLDAVAADGGAYLLAMDLDRAVRLSGVRLGGAVLGPGIYVYAGSAYGPGGVKARLGRHFRKRKRRRWHVDDLTSAARAVRAFPAPGGDECNLLQGLLSRPGFGIPLQGFGSSDCRHCPAHLVVFEAGI